MVDPISIIGLVGQISDLIQRAYNYGKAVHDAQSDMRKLYTELLGLKGVLEQLEKLDIASAEQHIADLIHLKEFRKTLFSTSELVGRLVENLNKKQTSSRRVNAFLWPWVKDDVKADIQDLERVKTWLIVMMIAENSTQMEVLMTESHEILNIAREGQARGKLKDQDRLLARESLFFLSVALRPLTIQELAEAAVLDDYNARIDDEYRLPEPMVLLEICQGLVDYDTATNVVTLAHSSVRAYITSSHTREGDISWFGYNIPGIHADIANKCLSYLLLEDFQNGCCTNDELKKKFEDDPLLRYASQYWPLHARLADREGRHEASALVLCLSHKKAGGGNFSFWVQCLMPYTPRDTITASEPLYYASSFGLSDLVKSLLTSESVDVDARGGRYQSSALHVACYRGHAEIARRLLDCGADINLCGSDGRTALFWAEKLGRTDIVDLLQDPKYAQSKEHTVMALSDLPEYIDYPMWLCCACNGGPQRGRFKDCWGCRSHERCEKCIKVAG
ncbi:hypothetical protein FANTH_9664 [Fusarium anthophilum]|uniref:GPI inositol-deacylase winged helix domain-containing protein n=1 Tax=Fusarium anthophilum TaxID=48485 RepID=A0A8H4Z5P8_9HYPO|nr:hypothetical protein FANTH_9664 [Fusarium anthophilum]